MNKSKKSNIAFVLAMTVSTQAFAQVGWMDDAPSQPKPAPTFTRPTQNNPIRSVEVQPSQSPATTTTYSNSGLTTIYNSLAGVAAEQGGAIWTGNRNNDQRLRRFFNFLPSIEMHGLNVSDYRFNAIYQSLSSSPASFEVEFSNEVLRLAKDVRTGRVNPGAVSRQVKFKRRAFTVDQAVLNFFSEPNSRNFYAIAPQHQQYRDLMELLSRLNDVNSRGGFAGIKSLPSTFKIGTVDSIIYSMKTVLNVYGFNLNLDNTFDAQFAEAVKKVQEANLGMPDGIVSPKNQDALAFFKVDSFARAQEVAITMEQLRWLPNHLPSRHLFLNTAIQELNLVDPALEVSSPIRLQKTINGRVDRQTPSMEDELFQVILNPTWTVPPGILAKDKLPPLKAAYLSGGPDAVSAWLEAHRFSLLDRGSNAVVDPAMVDWENVTAQDAPFKIVQSTGTDNALGVVKFNLKYNKENIYLHDTNERYLFNKNSKGRYVYNNRLKSSGCVRVEHPLELAAYLLQGTQWNLDKIENTVAVRGEAPPPSNFIKLPAQQVIQVYMLPLTAFKKNGVFLFAKDVYGQNRNVARALTKAGYNSSPSVNGLN